jgi:drug/metabolite transporter (DMT)-like permease
MKWEPRRLSAVFLATLGVVAVVYGGSTEGGGKSSEEASVEKSATSVIKPSAPLVGDLLTLIASIGYGIYQVLYKKYAALPSDPEFLSELHYDEIPTEDPPVASYNETTTGDSIKPSLPFGLYANTLTSVIGLLTFSTVWILIPVFHYLDIERFRLPNDITTCLVIAGIALSGVIFNAGFMASAFSSGW